jgi:polysaccharide deacetylase family protein (PEP-CTERM system associated)
MHRLPTASCNVSNNRGGLRVNREGAARRETLNAFTVDVEDYFQVAALASAIDRGSWPKRESRVERNTSVLLELLSEHGIRGTFFVLGWIAERHSSLIRRIAAEGHEIACHGFSHQLIYTQTPDEFREETARSKRMLEDLAGTAVAGYRAASFSITRRSMWALDVLIELGFEYDSSIFPIRHDRYGMPGADPHPAVLAAPSGRTLIEFPMSVARFAGVAVPVSGGGYFRLLPYAVTRAGLRQINGRFGRPFTFYLHPWEIDPGQPRIPVGWFSRFRHYTNLHRCEPRLRRLLGEFRFGGMREVLQGLGLLPGATLRTPGAPP